jgi:cell pole-organizing protein PopZ
MSEQTPTTSDDINGSDPSMEDILASIRKIISEDEPVAMESPEEIASGVSEMGQASLGRAEGESVDLNIDAVLADLDGERAALDAEPMAADMDEGDAILHAFDDVLAGEAEVHTFETQTLEVDASPADVDDDILSLLDEEIPLDTGSEDSVSAAKPLGLVPELAADAPSEAPDFSEDISAYAEAETEAVTTEFAAAGSDAVEEEDDIDALLNGLLGDDKTPSESASEIQAAETDVPEIELEEALETDLVSEPLSEPAGVGETEDLDLVKSLMADLSDDPDGLDASEAVEAPVFDEIEALDEDAIDVEVLDIEAELDALLAENTDSIDTDDELDSLLSIPDVEDTAAEAAVDMASEEIETETEDDILGEILDKAIDDEIQTHPDDLSLEDIVGNTSEIEAAPSLDDVLVAEQENIAANAELTISEPKTVETAVEAVASDIPSLSEIASAAEADAIAVETSAAEASASVPPAASAAGLAAIAGIGAIAAKTSSKEPETGETADLTPEPKTELKPEPISNPETEMPVKAVPTDTILDDVTEAATAGAFAELNQVVEDKAIFNERGPRIGDLVQDALRPMLKEWLDANLKGIVERAVAKEVKRISKGQ